MLDIDLFKSTNIIAGMRYDWSNAYAQDFQPFNDQAGQSPGTTPAPRPCRGARARFIRRPAGYAARTRGSPGA